MIKHKYFGLLLHGSFDKIIIINIIFEVKVLYINNTKRATAQGFIQYVKIMVSLKISRF